MNKLITFTLAFMAVLCLSYELEAANVPLAPMPQQEAGAQQRNIQLVQDIKAFIKQHPQLQLIRLNKKMPENHRSQSVKYTLGNRVSGDRMVGQYADTFFYPAKKDVSTQVTYPETGTGSVVTSVDINCLQDNTDGNAYVVAGGIGQRFISIVLEATQTERFSYNVHIYGRD
ncbi:uncharacterized protein LOC111681371 [Lucilia cuprina]|uniref:uncharacterized protein LOC111681371 n=1 Tax=Lucilia cuprina TaxID=7375 RepID=UPI001F053173|nr:uncharacterized protein LOC111681371 [Lucilia cuprina]